MTAAADTARGAPPLSVAQEALWYASRLAPSRLSYNETVSIRKEGPLDLVALRSAFAEIVRRHEAWRTTLDVAGGEPVQVVHPPPSFDLPVLDLGQLTPEQAERRAVGIVAEASRVPYDVRRGPLLRPRLIRFPGEQHRLYLAMHHLIFDGVSLYRVVLRELVAIYDAFAAGLPSPLPEPPPRYADYARWEQRWIAEPRARRRLEHWRARLASAPELPLPFDHPRPEIARGRGGVLSITVPSATVERLRRIGEAARASLFQVLATTWAALLGRYSGQDEVVFATPADLRQRPEFESVVGYCLTPLVLRVGVGGDPSFAELIVRVRNELLDGLDNLVPFERLVRELGHEPRTAANPVYGTMIVLEPELPAPDPAWSIHLMESGIGEAVGATKLDLELQLDERPEGHLAGRLIYDRELFEPSTAALVGEHWAQLAAAVAADPELPVARIPLLTPDEGRRLAEWNATATERPSGTMEDRLRARAASEPGAVALSAGEQDVFYAELVGSPAGVAERLRADGVGSGVGAALERMLAAGPGASALHLAAALAIELGLGPADTVLVLPEDILSVQVVAFWLPLAAGARAVLAPSGADGADLSRLIKAEQVSLLHTSPSGWRRLVASGLRPARALRALSGGGPLSRELADAVLERCRVLWNAYGSADTDGYATLGRVEAGGPVTIGRPLADTRAHVVDAHGRQQPVGVAGELLIAGAGAPEDGATVPEPGGTGRAHPTGERARWRSDGRLELVGRGLP